MQRAVCQCRGYARDLHRHCLQELVLQACPDAHRGDEDTALGVGFPHIIDPATHDDVVACHLLDSQVRLSTCDEKLCVWYLLPYLRHNLISQKLHRVDVRCIAHVASEHDIVFFLHLHRRVVVMVNAVWHYENLVPVRMIDICSVLLADDGLDVELIEDTAFIVAQAVVFHLKERP